MVVVAFGSVVVVMEVVIVTVMDIVVVVVSVALAKVANKAAAKTAIAREMAMLLCLEEVRGHSRLRVPAKRLQHKLSSECHILETAVEPVTCFEAGSEIS